MSMVDEVRARVHRLLCDWRSTVTLEDAHFVVDAGTNRALVAVVPWADTHAAVTVDAVTNWGLDPSPELYHHLATEGAATLVFGGVRAVERDDGKCNVALSYAFLGETADPEEIINAVEAILGAADELGGPIKARFGGALTWGD